MLDTLIQIFSEPAAWAALVTLIVMEVVLGIDNLIFISILTNKLPKENQAKARRIGIGGALLLRLGLLSVIAFIIGLSADVFTLFGEGFSWRDMILIAGGLFLIWKATTEIHHHVMPDEEGSTATEGVITNITAAIGQILLIDLVFSLDSIITAVGMTDHLPIMFIAVIVAVSVMYLAAEPLSAFIAKNPTIVMLALGFLLLIGTTLVAEGFGRHVDKNYIYAAMAFSAVIEFLNMRARKVRQQKLAKKS